jgi:hypothetical protein
VILVALVQHIIGNDIQLCHHCMSVPAEKFSSA